MHMECSVLGLQEYILYASLALAITVPLAGVSRSSVHCGLAATHVGRIAENSHMDVKVIFGINIASAGNRMTSTGAFQARCLTLRWALSGKLRVRPGQISAREPSSRPTLPPLRLFLLPSSQHPPRTHRRR